MYQMIYFIFSAVLIKVIILLVILLIKKMFDCIVRNERRVVDFSAFQYEPIAYESCFSLYESIRRKLIDFGYAGGDSVLVNLEKLNGHLERMLDRADAYCCGQIRANGFFSLSKLAFRLMERVDDELSFIENAENSAQTVQIIDSCFKLLLKMNASLDDEERMNEFEEELLKYPDYYRYLKMYRQNKVIKQTSDYDQSKRKLDLINNNSLISNRDSSKRTSSKLPNNELINSFSNTMDGEEYDSLPLYSLHQTTSWEAIKESIVRSNTESRELIYHPNFFLCWLDDGLRSFFSFYSFVLPFFRVRLHSYPRLILSSKFRWKILSQILW